MYREDWKRERKKKKLKIEHFKRMFDIGLINQQQQQQH